MASQSLHSNSWQLYRRLLGYVKPYRTWLGLACLAMVVDAAFTAGFAKLMEPMLDQGFGDRDPQFIRVLPWVILLVFVGRGIGSFVAQTGMAAVGRSVIRDLRGQVFDKYLRLPTEYFDQSAPGKTISRLTYNIEQVADASTKAITIALRDSLYIVGLLTVMALHSVKLTLATLVVGPLIALVVVLVSRRFRKISRRIQDSMGDVTHRASEVVLGQREVRIFGGQQWDRDTFDRINLNNRRQHIKLAATKAGSTGLVVLAAGLALAVIVWLATGQRQMAGLTAGGFASFMGAMLAILPSLKRLANVQETFQRGLAAAESVFDVLDREDEADDGQYVPDQVSGRVEFQGVGLRYHDEQEDVLADISFVAEPGTVTALVGRSGSGKTSLMNLLARLYQPSRGSIVLDGVDLADYGLAALRRNLAVVSQQVVLFEDTIAGNIAYGELRGAPAEAIAEAARHAYACEFIEQLPAGFDTRVGEGGIQLSGGQRQRVAIARAFLKQAPVLILDEATSALDNESEQHIQDALTELMHARTTFVIAHRMSTVESADQVIVLDNGRLVERGNHAGLIAKDSLYAALCRSQFARPD